MRAPARGPNEFAALPDRRPPLEHLSSRLDDMDASERFTVRPSGMSDAAAYRGWVAAVSTGKGTQLVCSSVRLPLRRDARPPRMSRIRKLHDVYLAPRPCGGAAAEFDR
ncbi:hypothetical protein BD309DRAFT_631859 [Dichomitus squalens]|uniref:Uncharacterized protein n=2 Tax=Dichomitus squalens TaxID=114155 RepID=A0A4Q9PIE8_9APHY|nr:uncharacterized protein DICSQDRAFT_156547 [Dichomitus squalens LYAD-421 SS1]EJF58910.1 hypothetical protein DICSQDRAFT_156547 [Dichomitus squalens LYAD-421 SS1]TBU24564.1 hypothetical protein BD311DRAFT_729382 [Dichomitus squalens]TBU37282.1 hypothetical protein BD309DRAFT_631859 [Dichomitus squalens]TBU53892.1 hypothetical protein BD310DRAFT_829183 [Dichomitus squalens]